MNRTEKMDTVAELQKKLAGSKAIILTDFRGLKVEQMTALRQRLRQDKIAYQVVKNTLMKKAIEGSSLEKLKDYFQGPTAVAISYGEPIALAKALTEFQKTLPNLEVKVGLIEGSLTSPPEIKSLATMPPREILLAQLLGTLQAPARRMLGGILGAFQQFLFVLQARIDQMAEREASQPPPES